MKKLTKKKINETLKKLDLKKQSSGKIGDWMKEPKKFSFEREDIWIIADSTTSFVDFNQN